MKKALQSLMVTFASLVLLVLMLTKCTDPTNDLTKDSSFSLGLTMVNVPAGTFQRDETETNISTVSAFKMSQHEITREQFETIMGADPSNTTYSSGPTDPVQMTNWYHAIAFCNKLSIAEGLTRVYDVIGIADDAAWQSLTFASIPIENDDNWNSATANWSAKGYRLPTEMEWMWAAMGAPADGQGSDPNTTGYTKDFSGSTGSNAIGNYAVFGYWGSETGRTTTERTNPAGSKTSGANELGLYDMSGNVWEWVWDWYADDGTWPNYAITGTHPDYRGADSGTYRIIRGGSWYGLASDCTVAHRSNLPPETQDADFGFRGVRP